MSGFNKQAPAGSFGTFGAAVTLVLLLPMFFLTIPALFFATKAKRLYKNGNYSLSAKLRDKAKRCTISAWLVAFIIALAMFALYFISRLSLI
ncbi:MAG: hypothetical protein IJ435_07320 [Clostridia bacterium]|nr:hypothetical protein [Clostridia bacterium]